MLVDFVCNPYQQIPTKSPRHFHKEMNCPVLKCNKPITLEITFPIKGNILTIHEHWPQQIWIYYSRWEYTCWSVQTSKVQRNTLYQWSLEYIFYQQCVHLKLLKVMGASSKQSYYNMENKFNHLYHDFDSIFHTAYWFSSDSFFRKTCFKQLLEKGICLV